MKKKNGKTFGFQSKWRKAIVVKTLLALALVTSVNHSFAQVDNSLISLNVKDVPVTKAIDEIKRKTTMHFIYNVEELKDLPAISLSVQNKPIEAVLEQMKKSSNLNYYIQNNTIVIGPNKTPGSAKVNNIQEEVDQQISGKVLGEDGQPLVGATVTELGTSNATVTNANGEFTLNVNDNAKIQVSYVGMDTKVITVGKQRTILIALSLKTESLNSIVVNAGYYKAQQRDLTGSISSVSAKTIERQPVTNVLQSLQGRLPGVQIDQQSGIVGGGMNVKIRAAAGLTAGTNPLYIIDGVPFVGEALYTAGGNNSGGLKPGFGSSPLNAINPSDIEDISVLKDADATAIYGSRGANGVVLITTKRAKGGKGRFDINVSTGTSTVADLHRVKTVTLAQYLEMRNQAFANSYRGTTPTAVNAPDLVLWDTTKSNDLQKEFFGKSAGSSDANMSFSAGNKNLNFLISGTYHNEGSITPGDFNYQRGGVRTNVNYNSDDNKIGINVGVNYNVDQNRQSSRAGVLGDLGSVAYSFPLNFPLYNTDGSLYWHNADLGLYQNPLSARYKKYNLKNSNLLGNLGVQFEPAKGFIVKLNGSYNKITLNETDLTYSKAINPFIPGTGALPSAFYQENYVQTWNFEPTAEYSRGIGKGKLNALAGATYQSSSFVQPFYISASGFSTDAMLRNYTSASSYTITSYDSKYKYNSVFGRLNYKLLNKYIVNVNYRWDASSKFGINKRFGSFGSVGGAWIISEEDFVKNKMPFISFAKLRASYGSSGNDQISNSLFSENYRTQTYQYDAMASLTPDNIANPDLTWELNKKFEAGLDLSLLKDRINVSASWFRNRTDNPLASYPISTVTGFTKYTANIDASIETYGTEFSLNTQNIRNQNFIWTTDFNISFPKNKLVSFNSIENTSYINDKIIGSSLSNIYGFQYAGFDATGLPSVVDADHNGTTNDGLTGLAIYGKGDYVKIGNTNPDFFGGVNNSFSYKGVRLDVFVQFVGRRMIKGIGASDYSPYGPGTLPGNMTELNYELFKATGGKLARINYDYRFGNDDPETRYSQYANSDAIISNAAFTRLKNVSLSYDLPAQWINKIKMQKATVYVHGQNLLTRTKFAGYDPETSPTSIPPLRTIVFGLKASF